MKPISRTLRAAIVASLLLPAAIHAHHGYAGFDRQTEVTFQATVTAFHFVSPHSVVEFEITEKGEVQRWQGELTSTSHLAPNGWNASTLEPGNKIAITGHRASNGVHSLWVTKIVLDGKQLKLGAAN